jgi:cysteine dioxygenase
MSPRVEEFLATLDTFGETLPLEELIPRLEALNIKPQDCAEHVLFDEASYARNLLHTGPGCQVLVLCWLPGQRSKIHDHRGSGCGVLVLEGTATEILYTRGSDGMLMPGETNTLQTGDVCGSWDADIHEIANNGSGNLITLHVYAPPLLEAGIYTLDSPQVSQWLDPNGAAAVEEARSRQSA